MESKSINLEMTSRYHCNFNITSCNYPVRAVSRLRAEYELQWELHIFNPFEQVDSRFMHV